MKAPRPCLCLLFLLTVAAADARADAVIINPTQTIIDPSRIAQPGDTLIFYGTFTNPNAEAATLSRSGSVGVGHNFTNVMFFQSGLVLPPNSTTGVLPLFQLTIVANPVPPDGLLEYVIDENGATVMAYIVSRGGFQMDVRFASDPRGFGTLGQTTFVIRIPQPQAVPEPATLALLATGLAGGAALRRRRAAKRAAR